MAKRNAPRVETFGCRLNIWESEVVRDRAVTAGLADAIIFNTCAVTAEAERQARQAIRRARRDNPDSRIVVTGCAAQIAPDSWDAMPEVDHVVGNRPKHVPVAGQQNHRGNIAAEDGTGVGVARPSAGGCCAQLISHSLLCSAKLEPLDIRLADFDNCLFRIFVDAANLNTMYVSISMSVIPELKM